MKAFNKLKIFPLILALLWGMQVKAQDLARPKRHVIVLFKRTGTSVGTSEGAISRIDQIKEIFGKHLDEICFSGSSLHPKVEQPLLQTGDYLSLLSYGFPIQKEKRNFDHFISDYNAKLKVWTGDQDFFKKFLRDSIVQSQSNSLGLIRNRIKSFYTKNSGIANDYAIPWAIKELGRSPGETSKEIHETYILWIKDEYRSSGLEKIGEEEYRYVSALENFKTTLGVDLNAGDQVVETFNQYYGVSGGEMILGAKNLFGQSNIWLHQLQAKPGQISGISITGSPVRFKKRAFRPDMEPIVPLEVRFSSDEKFSLAAFSYSFLGETHDFDAIPSPIPISFSRKEVLDKSWKEGVSLKFKINYTDELYGHFQFHPDLLSDKNLKKVLIQQVDVETQYSKANLEVIFPFVIGLLLLGLAWLLLRLYVIRQNDLKCSHLD